MFESDLSDEEAPAAVPPKPARTTRATRPNGNHPTNGVIHTSEFDAGLLGTIFADPSVLDRCAQIGITDRSFDSLVHAAIFRTQSRLHAQHIAPDQDVVAAELMHDPVSSGINIFAAIAEVASSSSTSAQADYFLSKVRDGELRRALIQRARADLERAQDLSEPVETIEIGGPVPRGLTSFQIPPDNDSSILLGNRYLNRGDGAVLSSTSGMGKSSLSLQLAVLWALGETAFGIKPNGPLKSLIIQAEDSDGDVGEMWASIKHSLQLSPDQLAQVQQNIRIVTDRVNRGLKFRAALKSHLIFSPDLVWINPLQAFMDGDVTQSQDLGLFLREHLNSLNHPARFAYILVHHTVKPATGKDRAERLWHEVMYDMAGGAELINWARAILSLRPTETDGDFNLVLAKRGRRAGVVKRVEQGAAIRLEPQTVIPLRHARAAMPVLGRAQPMPVIFWEGREPDVAKKGAPAGGGGRAPKYAFPDFRSVFPAKSTPGLELNQLHRALMVNLPIPKKSLHEALKRWEDEGAVEIIRPPKGAMRYRLALD